MFAHIMMSKAPLGIDFYDRPTLKVARDLLGCILVRRTTGGRVLAGRIVETEAYIGENDKACHASKGMTERTRIMFGPPGHAYIYLIYGMYHCLNVVTERDGFPAAVLLRGLEPVKGFDAVLKALKPARQRIFLSGPGRLCREMNITRDLDGQDMTAGSGLFILPADEEFPASKVEQTPRIGVDYAGEDALLPWRFVVRR